MTPFFAPPCIHISFHNYAAQSILEVFTVLSFYIAEWLLVVAARYCLKFRNLTMHRSACVIIMRLSYSAALRVLPVCLCTVSYGLLAVERKSIEKL